MSEDIIVKSCSVNPINCHGYNSKYPCGNDIPCKLCTTCNESCFTPLKN